MVFLLWQPKWAKRGNKNIAYGFPHLVGQSPLLGITSPALQAEGGWEELKCPQGKGHKSQVISLSLWQELEKHLRFGLHCRGLEET